MMGLVGKKIGMTRFFKKAGDAIPMTVIKIEENRITQIKTLLHEGYSAIQVTTGYKKKKIYYVSQKLVIFLNLM